VPLDVASAVGSGESHPNRGRARRRWRARPGEGKGWNALASVGFWQGVTM
jgi:hypothetical protein